MVTVNGEQKEIAGRNLYEYLREEGFNMDRIVVERNLEIVDKNNLPNIVIGDEDSIEVICFVGGG